MNKTMIMAAACTFAGSNAIHAQETGISWEGEIEIGIESTISADDPASEMTDAFAALELAFEAAISRNLSVFGGLSLESVLDPTDDRAFEDLGLYVSELGLRYSLGETTISVGKISPAFAVAWDEAPGYFGTALAEDYELSEMIGASLETPLGAGQLSIAVFHTDDTALSDSIGTRRGRTSVADGGVGNTGKLNNLALHYSQDFGATTGWVSARHMSAGQGDASDETGLAAGLAHDFNDSLSMIGEVAHFNGAGGTSEDATYLTLGAAYAVDVWTLSAVATVVDHETGGNDSMFTIGVDRNIRENLDMSFGIARFDVDGETSTSLGLSAVYTF